MIQQKKELALQKILNSYLAGQYADMTAVFDTLKDTMEDCILSEKDMSQFSKLLSIFFLGQLVELPTLSRILTYCGISSNASQKKDVSVCNKLTNKQLHDCYEGVFEHIVRQQLSCLVAKHGSALSRTLVTFVLDDSIFKQWLSKQINASELEKCPFYSQFFSGQMHQVVWGYQVVVVGVNIGNVFFPLYFECVRKTAESVKVEQAKYVALVAEWKAECVKKTLLLAEIKEKKAVSTTEDDKNAIKILCQDLKILNISVKSLYNKKKTTKPAKKVPEKIAVATKLIRKVGILIENLRKKHDKTLVFQFSCDSGYSDSRLLLAATDSHLNYISVLKKAHKVTINGETITIKDWIETVYKPAEIAHYAAQKDFPENKKTLFSLRIRCRYEAMDQDVTFLAFRLTDSTKVNAIYSPNKNIFAKTLRHHWFARTQIEQFFKLLKHYMHIEETRPRTKHRLEYIILRFAFIAIQIQKLIRLLRRKRLLPPKSALGTLRTILATTPFIKEYLNGLFQDLLQTNKPIKS